MNQADFMRIFLVGPKNSGRYGKDSIGEYELNVSSKYIGVCIAEEGKNCYDGENNMRKRIEYKSKIKY